MRYVALIICLTAFADLRAAQVVVQQVDPTTYVPNYRGALPEFSTLVTYHNELYFTSTTTGNNSYRLFKTDGTNLAAFDVDPETSVGTQFVEFQDQLYFRGSDGERVELFRTDGQTLTKYDLSTSPYGSAPRNFTVVGERLYFEATLLGANDELRATLFVAQGTTITPIADIEVESSYPWHFPAADTVYFPANGPNGFELYRTGSRGIHEVVDANPGNASSDPWPGLAVGNDFYFTARGPNGREAYRTNGDLVVKLPMAADPELTGGPVGFVQFGGNVFFTAQAGNGIELYRTDGNTTTELDLNPGPAGSYPQTYGDNVLRNQLLVPATGPNGTALFVLDRDGTVTRRFDFQSHASRSAVIFREFRGEAYFEALGPAGSDLYKTDGNTLTKFNIAPDGVSYGAAALYDSIEYHDWLYFPAVTSDGLELVKTDGTQTVTLDLNPGSADSTPRDLQIVGDQLVFTATGPTGPGIFALNGDTISKIADFEPNMVEYHEHLTLTLPSTTIFARLGDQLLFLAKTPDGFQLHRIVAIPEPPCGAMTATVVGIACYLSRTRRQGSC